MRRVRDQAPNLSPGGRRADHRIEGPSPREPDPWFIRAAGLGMNVRGAPRQAAASVSAPSLPVSCPRRKTTTVRRRLQPGHAPLCSHLVSLVRPTRAGGRPGLKL